MNHDTIGTKAAKISLFVFVCFVSFAIFVVQRISMASP
jgi:hypothetical protein